MLSDKLIDLRERQDISQTTVAKFLNMSPVGYGSYERGLRYPPIDTLVKLAEFYHVSLDYLLCRKGAELNTTGEFDAYTDLIDDIKDLPSKQQQQIFEYVRLMKLDNAINSQTSKKKFSIPTNFPPALAAYGEGRKNIDHEMDEDMHKAFDTELDNKEIKD